MLNVPATENWLSTLRVLQLTKEINVPIETVGLVQVALAKNPMDHRNAANFAVEREFGGFGLAVRRESWRSIANGRLESQQIMSVMLEYTILSIMSDSV